MNKLRRRFAALANTFNKIVQQCEGSLIDLLFALSSDVSRLYVLDLPRCISHTGFTRYITTAG
jgi:hypothetical protein